MLKLNVSFYAFSPFTNRNFSADFGGDVEDFPSKLLEIKGIGPRTVKAVLDFVGDDIRRGIVEDLLKEVTVSNYEAAKSTPDIAPVATDDSPESGESRVGSLVTSNSFVRQVCCIHRKIRINAKG